MTQLTTDELAAKDALVKQVTHLSKAYGELLVASGGLDVAGLGLNIQVLLPQFDALVDLLANAGLIDRTAYFNLCKEKMREAEKGVRDATEKIPRIAPAQTLPKTNGR